MKKFLKILTDCPLFKGMSEDEISEFLRCLNSSERNVKKGEIIFSAGDPARYIGIVLSGGVCVAREDYRGDRIILAVCGQGDLFAEAFAASAAKTLPVTVSAQSDGYILLIDCLKLMSAEALSPMLQSTATANFLKILADKNIRLTQKINHITQKTTSQKVLSLLSEYAENADGKPFKIPLNRQELADYLSVERSALSAVLSKMQKDGIIEYKKNTFRLL